MAKRYFVISGRSVSRAMTSRGACRRVFKRMARKDAAAYMVQETVFR